MLRRRLETPNHSLTIWRDAQGTTLPMPSMYGVYTYIYHKNQPNVGKYMDPMGYDWCICTSSLIGTALTGGGNGWSASQSQVKDTRNNNMWAFFLWFGFGLWLVLWCISDICVIYVICLKKSCGSRFSPFKCEIELVDWSFLWISVGSDYFLVDLKVSVFETRSFCPNSCVRRCLKTNPRSYASVAMVWWFFVSDQNLGAVHDFSSEENPEQKLSNFFQVVTRTEGLVTSPLSRLSHEFVHHLVTWNFHEWRSQ